MPDGFFGKILFVDLSRGTVEEESLDPAIYRGYLGGYGLGVRLLYERMSPGVDPLGAENILGFTPGLLTGTGVPFSGRFMVVGKSPLTGGWGDANCGGHFGPALRATGFDGVFVRGISTQPVYLFIDKKEDRIELRDAGHLWGLDSVETDRQVKEEVGRDARVVCIGSGGEKLSLVAGIVTDGGRLAARSGLGAVMGAKRLKAVVVRGAQQVPVQDKGSLSRLSKEYRQIFREKPSPMFRYLSRITRLVLPLIRRFRLKFPMDLPQPIIYIYKEYGTCSGTAFATEIGDAPVKNWLGSGMHDFPLSQSALISDDAVIQHQVKNYGCQHCPLSCGGIVSLKGPRYTIEETHKPEYETLAGFGTLLLNDDLESIIQMNDICDRYGLDTISVATIVGFALECAEKGLLSREETDGLDLAWGNAEAIVELVRKIARREGIGDLLADGVKRAAERIGNGSEAFAMHVGGQELAMHDSRYEPVLGLAYQVDPTPGRHTVADGGIYDLPALREILDSENLTPPEQYEYEGKGALFALMNRYIQVVNCAGLCMFSLIMGRPPVREWINAATGWDLSLKELLHVGHRIQVMRHVFNLREGIRLGDFSLPARATGIPPLDEGPLRGVTLDMETMIQDYHRTMGYDEATGVPTGELLESLGLSQVTGDLKEIT
ncbi:MAG: aldehyde ferredoxin oxidoreductase family protein [Anaerolineae bacterium]